MRRWLRAWGTTVLAWGLVLIMGGAAIAGAGSSTTHRSSKAGTNGIEVSESQEATEAAEAPESTVSPDAEETHAPGDTHGACVSHWAHEAKDQGLEGSDFGHFVSTVAQSDETGEDCDFSEQLTAALAAQAAAESSPATHGKSAEHSQKDAGLSHH